MAIRAWRPVDKIDTNQYLYHYTTMEKAYSILFSNELWFSDLTSTNDIFEQKVKISFKNVKDSNLGETERREIIDKINEVREYMDRTRANIKLLCFSRDIELSNSREKTAYTKLQESLLHEYRAINVMKHYEYEIDIDRYILIWDKFMKKYYYDKKHQEISVQEQIMRRQNNHMPYDYYLKFDSLQPGVYYILRTEKHDVPQPYIKYVMSLFGIKKKSDMSVGYLRIIKAKDFGKYVELYKNAGVSAFKIVVQ